MAKAKKAESSSEDPGFMVPTYEQSAGIAKLEREDVEGGAERDGKTPKASIPAGSEEETEGAED